MGDFGPKLLAALAGQVGEGSFGGPTSPVRTVPPEAGAEMNPGMQMFGITPDMLPPPGSVPGIAGGSFGGQPNNVDAIVKGFKPKKISFWGALGDQLLKHWGNEPAFAKRIENKNMMRAMEGFTHDPMEMVRRMSQIPGMQNKALELWDKIEDNKRANDTAQSLIQTRREKIINSASRLFGPQSLAPDGRNYSTIRGLFMNIMERNGITDVYLPEEYNPDVINAQIAGDWTLNQQDLAKYRPREQARKEANTASVIDRREDQTRQGDARIAQGDRAETGRNTRAAVAEAGRNARASQKVNKDGTLERKLPDGSTIKYSSDKSKAIVVRPNGKKHYLERQLNGHYKTTAVE